ncbi:MAG: universal stress protein [Anaerolineales bacterium]|jgi:nucleotide-binding universal stress UspA family protein
MIKRILLTLDGSPLAEEAIHPAILHAQAHEAELHILRVVSPLTKSYRAGKASLSAIETAERDLKFMAQDYLDDKVEQLSSNGLNVQAAMRNGQPYEIIIQYATKNKIDLIVMARRGESGLTRWLIGSVTDHVVRASPIPVLVVPVVK